MEPDALRDNVAQYWLAYYREVRNVLGAASWGATEVPTHFIPKPRTIRLHQARDGFILEHFNRDPGTGSYEAFEVYPPTNRTVRELTGGSFNYQEGASILWSMAHGKTLGHPEHDEALNPDFRQRYDVITNEKVAELTTEKAQKKAREDLSVFVDI